MRNYKVSSQIRA